jgi:hypothetical protein
VWGKSGLGAVVLVMVKSSFFSRGYLSKKRWTALWMNSIRGDGKIVVKKLGKTELSKALQMLTVFPGRIHLSGAFKGVPRTPILDEFLLEVEI